MKIMIDFEEKFLADKKLPLCWLKNKLISKNKNLINIIFTESSNDITLK